MISYRITPIEENPKLEIDSCFNVYHGHTYLFNADREYMSFT